MVNRIVIGSDDAGHPLKEVLKGFLQSLSIEVIDKSLPLGDPATSYPDTAEAVARSIAAGEFERGILVCGTGIGVCIAANKVPGIYAALCHDVYSAERARKSNNAQIITMGARVIGPELAKTVIAAWLNSEFAGGGSASKVQRVGEIDAKYRQVPS